ncbi:MAG: GIY-YIG nuclease family protein [Pseudomonadota bacterium]
MHKQPAIYIVTNKQNGTLYTGVTSNLSKRIYEHKNNLVEGFTSKYKCHRLVYFEIHETMESAIEREKQIKAGSRKKKLALIENQNPNWNDLYDRITQ